MMENDAGREGLRLKIEINDVNLISSVVEMEEDGVGSARYENEGKLWEIEEESNVGFARQKPGVTKVGCYGIKKQKLKKVSVEDNKKKHSRVELGKLFQSAVSFHDWDFAESLILLVDPLILNDFLCISLDSIWFLRTHEELIGIVGLIKKTMSNGAFDFTRAALRTSFLASCVSACRSQTMSLADTVTVMGDRLHERLQDCNVNNILKAEAASKVQKFTEWALKCIGFHSRCHGNRDKTCHDSAAETYLQLSAFKTFLHLAGNNLTGKDFTEAFDAACFPLTLFSSWFDPGWSSGASANIIQGLLTILVDGGADNVNQCFLEASRFGSSELVCILLQIAQRNSLDVDVDLALGFASHYGKISTMDCLVKEGNAKAFLGPLMRASERGCLLVVRWFVQRGCQDMELCLALTAATSSSQVEVAAFLLPQVPQQVLAALSIEILKAAGERSDASFEGVSFLLHSNFLGDAAITYSVADSIARSEDGSVGPDLQAFFRDHWSEAAFIEGQFIGQEHFVNMIRVLNRGESPLRIGDLPMPMRVAIAYLPLYRECVEAGGCLLSQRLRGELMEAVRRLGGVVLREPSQNQKLVAILRYHLRPFLPGLNLTCSCKQTTLRQQMDGV